MSQRLPSASRSRIRRPLALGALAAGALATATVPSRPAAAFGRDGLQHIHERITRNALTFLADGVADRVVDGNLDEDEGAEADLAERHGVNCRFHAAASYANMRYQQVVDALRTPQANDPNRAPRLFGHILHGVQDFYSHSNWIPTPPEGLGIRGRLLETGLGPWRMPAPYAVLFDDVVLVAGDAPAGVSVRLPLDANGRVSSAVPIVEDRRIFTAPVAVATTATLAAARGFETPTAVAVANFATPLARPPVVDVGVRRFRGLMTAGAPRQPGDQICPPVGGACDVESAENVCLRHGDSRSSDTSSRNFVGAGRMNLDGGGDGDWWEARHHAKLQTQHEWCRLLHLSRDLDPSFTASGRLLGTWVASDSAGNTPHIASTPCARGAARRHLIEIAATPEANAPSSVPFVVFRSDFTSSARTTVARQATKTLRICGNPGETIVGSVMPAQVAGATLVVPVPTAARSWTVRDHRGGFAVSFVVTVTPDAC
jgi:hypothetical protein